MTEKRYLLVKCIQNQWGIADKTLESVDQLILMHYSKLTLKEIVNELNEKERLKEENKELKKQLLREETDKKRLMSYLMRYKGFAFDEIVEDFLDEPYYDKWWEDGFYESCWDDYLKEKGFDGCDEE